MRDRGVPSADYLELWRWSVREPDAFWTAVWDFYDVKASAPYRSVRDRTTMPGARWFEGARLNYGEHLLRHAVERGDATAIHAVSELRATQRISWTDLAQQVRNVATRLRELGVRPGDRVVGYLPNIPEAVIAMIATISVGAVWSVAAPEFGVRTVIDRFAQIEPKVLFAVDGYRFAGRDCARKSEVEAILAALPSIETLIWLPYLDAGASVQTTRRVIAWPECCNAPHIAAADFEFEQLDSMAPLWVLFSSGTTGLPKAIVHGHVGVLIEHLKGTGLHWDITPESCVFFYSTTGWVVWNGLISSFLQGSSIVLYDGSPNHPGPERLWQLAGEFGATCFGTSPSYLQGMQRSGVVPATIADLSRLRNVFLSGSPTTPAMFEWLYRNVKRDVWLASGSGGTEIATGWVGGVPTLPVYADEMQARYLGLDVHAWDDDGRDVLDAIGELVVTAPAPSMPIYFWNDPDGRRYHEAYFDHFPNVWTHGDRIKFNARGGSTIYGRSDATLNRHGVRIGSAEIYRVVERLETIADSLVVCIELSDGRFFMPLFVEMRGDIALTDATRQEIAKLLREECSPRHVPDDIIAVDAIPYTLTGKRMEVPVRKILLGVAPDKAAGRDTMRNPESLAWFIRFAATYACVRGRS